MPKPNEQTIEYSPTMPWIIEAEAGGRFTIPKEIREKFNVRKKKRFALLPFNGLIILSPIEKPTPKKEEFMVREAMRQRKITLKSLIETAEKEGKSLYQELYEKKKK